MKLISAGELRHPIKIQSPTESTPDAYGGRSASFEVIAKPWAAIEPASGRELDYARSFAATVTHKITVRYLAGVKPDMQIVYGTRTFSINGVVNVEERNIQLILFCTELVE